jgi:hypothetical protein
MGRDPISKEDGAMRRQAAADTSGHKTGNGVDDLLSQWLGKAATVGVTSETLTDSVLAECVDLDPADTSARRRGSDGRSVWIEPSARDHTSSAVLAQEEHIICWAMDAQLDPPAPSTGVTTGRPDVMQAEAAAAGAGSDRLVLVVGPAGTGGGGLSEHPPVWPRQRRGDDHTFGSSTRSRRRATPVASSGFTRDRRM